MVFKLSEIIDYLGDSIESVNGKIDHIVIKYLKDPKEVDKHTLDWVNPLKKNKQQIAETTEAKAILVDSEVVYSQELQKKQKVLIYVNNPKICIALIANKFFDKKRQAGIHPSAMIDKEVQIGDNTYIGPNCILEKCIIGDNVQLHGNNFIYENVVVGNNVEIHAGAVVGNEAHNFVEDDNGGKVKFPHLGGVIIEDNVTIGAQSVISKGVLSNTIIGEGTKIAQLVFIGANNKIGVNCAIRPNVMTSGSVMIGDYSIIASSATIREQTNIGTNSFIGMGAVVTKNVPDNEIWVGNPARKLIK